MWPSEHSSHAWVISNLKYDSSCVLYNRPRTGLPTSEGVVAVVHLLLEVPQPRDDEDEAEDLEADVGGEHADVAAGVEEEGSEGQRHQVGQVAEEA